MEEKNRILYVLTSTKTYIANIRSEKCRHTVNSPYGTVTRCNFSFELSHNAYLAVFRLEEKKWTRVITSQFLPNLASLYNYDFRDNLHEDCALVTASLGILCLPRICPQDVLPIL